MMRQNLQQKKVSTLSAKKNVLVLFLSPKPKKDPTMLHYKAFNYKGERTIADGKETNDPYVRFLLDEVHDKNQSLNNIYILCSEKVRNENGVEYFRDKVYDYCRKKGYNFPSIDGVPYNESQNDSKAAALESVLLLSEAFQRDTVDVSAENITVYMDFAGGMRDTALLMTAILRLFAFQDIEVMQIMYAHLDFDKKDDPDGNHHLSDLTEIYHLYDLIAGAEEFTSYGSVKDLNGYYKNKKISTELEALLNAMNAFASDLKLCAFGRFKETLMNLGSALNDFERKADKDQNEQIFSILIERIKAEYAAILKPEADLLDYVKWSIEKEYIQQALTLLNEHLPTYIVVEQKIIYPEKLFHEDGTLNKTDEWKIYIEKYNKSIGMKWMPWESTFLTFYEDLEIYNQLRDKRFKKNYKVYETIVQDQCFDVEQIRKIKDTRREIRELRNKINHASESTLDGKKLTAENIKQRLSAYYENLVQLIKKGERNVY